MAKKQSKALSWNNLLSLDYKTLIHSKSFWVGVVGFVLGLYTGSAELVIGSAGVVVLRDALTK